MALFREEELNYDTNAIGVQEFIKTLEPDARIRFETFFGFAFSGRAQDYEEQEDFIGEGDTAYRNLTQNNHWRIQEELFNVIQFDNGSVEIIQIKSPDAYKGKGK